MKYIEPNRFNRIRRTSYPKQDRETIKEIKFFVLAAPLLALSLTVFGCGGGGSSGGSAGDPAPSGTGNVGVTDTGWSQSYRAGYVDAQGHYAGGTEILWIVGHKGKLYAANGYWMDTDNGYAQILRLDSPNGQWQVDLEMGRQHIRAESLRSLTFTTDGNGNPLAQPVNLLVAGAWSGDTGAVTLFVRDDTTGTWQGSRVYTGSSADLGGQFADSEARFSCRAVNVHRDRVTGVDRIFFDVGTKGIWSGVYDSSLPGKIRWDTNSETGGLPTRVLAIIEANNSLLFSSGSLVYRRNDGASPSYTVVAGASDLYQGLAMPIADGIRGMTTIPSPQGTGDSILFAWMDCIYRLDPDGLGGYTRRSEVCLANSIMGSGPLSWVLAAYNDMLPVVEPGTSETVYIIGFETCINVNQCGGSSGYYSGARYAIRGADGSYRVKEIDPGSNMLLRGTRTYALSPFREDNGRSIYFGGFDCDALPAHNTAWVFQTSVENALR